MAEAATAKWFKDLLGADLADARPGEILVVRSARREEAETVGSSERITPVCVCVGGGRAVVSVSRFLLRVAEAWAEGFPAPEMLLREQFLHELSEQVRRAMGGSLRTVYERVMVRSEEAVHDDATGPRPRITCQGAPKAGGIRCCESADRAAIQRLLRAGYREHARCVRFEIER